MKKLFAILLAAAFAGASLTAVAGEKKSAKPTAEECKKDPKMKGCEKK